MIALRGVCKSYQEGARERLVLDHVDADIAEGELVVLVGRSGSGKSSLLNLISGIDPPSAGSITIDGAAINTLTERERTLFRRQRIGFVFQTYNLIPTLSVIENLLLPLELNAWPAKQARERAMEMLEAVALADRHDSPPDQLSGGEQQRVAVARALVHDPALVLADEPTGNLDVDTGQEVVALLDRLTRQAGKTMLMVTHSLEVAGVADRIMTLRDGHLVPYEAVT